jgi:hypothetical protein
VGPYWSYAFSEIQNLKIQTGFCSKCYFFAESSAHWTLLYMTASTLHTWCYNSVIDSFLLQEPQVGPYLSNAFFRNSKFQKHKLDFVQNVTFLQDQVHIRDTALHDNFYFETMHYISVIDSFAPSAPSGTILELCFFRNSKFQKHKQDFVQNVTFFAGSSAHWTLLYMTTSILKQCTTLVSLTVFCSKSLKWDHTGVMPKVK